MRLTKWKIESTEQNQGRLIFVDLTGIVWSRSVGPFEVFLHKGNKANYNIYVTYHGDNTWTTSTFNPTNTGAKRAATNFLKWTIENYIEEAQKALEAFK